MNHPSKSPHSQLRGRVAATAGTLGLLAGTGALVALMRRVNAISRHPKDSLTAVRAGSSSPLFDRFPGLADRIPWRPLGSFPTPVEEMPPVPGAPDVRLFVKRDDLSAGRYGGNKVRKLEHFLAEAELATARSLITLGGIGSNHALATASHGAALGFESDLVLYDQPVNQFVRKNVGGFLAVGARLHYAGSLGRAFLTAGRLHALRHRAGESPYFIMVGGTSRLGCVGHVTAGLELGRQVADGVLPEPDHLFIPLGTCGTAAGLVVGLKLAGLRTRVVAVRVADPIASNAVVLRYLAQDVADFLANSDPRVPRLRIEPDDFMIVLDHFGSGYGHPTEPAESALRWAAPQLSLDTTYSGKALAACLEFCRRCSPGRKVLFWNTFNSAPLPADPPAGAQLPSELRPLID